jgi:hypothetical protein
MAITPTEPDSANPRTARHLRLCAEMADLAADLARAAAARALLELTEPPATPEPAPEPAPEPSPAPVAARAATPRRPSGTSLRIPSCKPVSAALLFTHLVATMRACIELEARLAAALTTPSAAAAAQAPDPRRDVLSRAFRHILQDHPGRAQLLRQTTEQFEAHLAADPAQTTPHSDILCTIADDLGIEIDFAHLPDEFLGIPPATAPP